MAATLANTAVAVQPAATTFAALTLADDAFVASLAIDGDLALAVVARDDAYLQDSGTNEGKRHASGCLNLWVV